MNTVEGKKQEKRRALLDAAYELFLERGASKTSVEDITSRAKVGKGTFYLYFADKGAVTQALLARVSYQLLDDAVTACERASAPMDFPDKMIFVIDHIIEALRNDTLMLRFLERSFVWPGLDKIEASGEAEPLMRKLLHAIMSSPEMAGLTEREVYQRITALGSMCMSVCFPASNRVTSIYQIQKVEKISIRIFPFLFPLHAELIFDECYNSDWRKMN